MLLKLGRLSRILSFLEADTASLYTLFQDLKLFVFPFLPRLNLCEALNLISL